MDFLLEGGQLGTDLGRGAAQLGELCRTWLSIAKTLTETTGGFDHFFQLAEHLNRYGLGRRVLLVGLGAKEQPRICQEPLTHLLGAAQEGRAQVAHLTAAQLSCRDRLG